MPEEYIYFRDYVKILWKRKWVVILVSIISVITTAVFIFGFQKLILGQKLYEAVATIQNGFIESPIIEKQESFEMIKISAGDMGKEIQFEDLPNTLWFKIKLKTTDPDLMKRLVQNYIDNGNNLYNKQYEIYIQKEDVLIKKKKILEKSINETQDAIDDLSKIKTKELTDLQRYDRVLWYKNNIRDIKIQILDLENGISDINQILAKSKQFATVLPVRLNEVNRLKKKTKLLLSAIFGSIGGILLAFAIENWSAPGKGGK